MQRCPLMPHLKSLALSSDIDSTHLHFLTQHLKDQFFFGSEASPDRLALPTLLGQTDLREDLLTAVPHINHLFTGSTDEVTGCTLTALSQVRQTWCPSTGLTSAASSISYPGGQGGQEATSSASYTVHTCKDLASMLSRCMHSPPLDSH